MKTHAQIARELLDLFGPNGERWTKGRSVEGGPPVPTYGSEMENWWATVLTLPECKFCLAGGLAVLNRTDYNANAQRCNFQDRFTRAVQERTGRLWWSIVLFNDAPSTTWADVKATLEYIAAGFPEVLA